MQNRPLIRWMLGLLCITAGLLLWYHYGMNRTFTLNSATHYPIESYDDRLYDGTSVATVEKASQAIVLHCQLTNDYPWPYCGFKVVLGEKHHGVDFSDFDTVTLNIDEKGKHKLPIRVYLRNYNPAYSKPGVYNSLKVNQIQYSPEMATNPLTLPLNTFQVASWWVNNNNILPRDAAPDISNVVTLEVATGSNSKPVDYTIDIRSITFRGKWLSIAQLLSIILALWLLSTLFYLANALFRATYTMRTVGQQKKALEDVNDALSLKQQELETRATHDELTKAYNRAGLRDYLYDMVPRAQQGKEELSIIFMDIDHFKTINDQYGHVAGDEILIQLADFVMQCTREDDYFCRWGGEEFILLCRRTTLKRARSLAEKLRAKINNNDWHQDIALHCSFGVSHMRKNESIEDFIRRADKALYNAKGNGRNRVEG